jgi:hypothetical protein
MVRRRSVVTRRLAAVIAVLFALVAVSYLVVVRPWHMRWGASRIETSMQLTGDPLMPPGAIVSTRAIDIDAPIAEVWRWLVQIGQGRGGFYSYDWLENLFGAGMRNAERIEPRLQSLAVGDTISYMHEGPTAIVTVLEHESAVVLGEGWTFELFEVGPAATRLVVRYPYDHGGNVLHALFYYLVFEPAHFVMESRMMLGIKDRAEASFNARRAVATRHMVGLR